MAEAHFDVEAVLDRAFKQKGTVTIDREKGTLTIRPRNSRRVYTTTLNEVATIVVQRLIKEEVAITKVTRRRKVPRGILSNLV